MFRFGNTPNVLSSLRRRFGRILAGCGLCVFVLLCGSARGEDWMFRRSYFSHVIPPERQQEFPRPVSRSAYRRPILRHRPGFAIRGGYRFDTMRIQTGSSSDVTVFRENWFDYRP